jgi:hypothetical protein
MVNHPLTGHFDYFFGQLNPSSTFERKASEHYSSVKALIEDRSGLARELSPVCFLQGSYRHVTATYTINDIDIVALCSYLWDPGQPGLGTRYYSRDDIFGTVAAPLLNDWRYRDKVRYNSQSMCIKLDTEPRIEILPVVHKYPNTDPSNEPFRLFRPENNRWEDGYARYHKGWLSWKNQESKTKTNFIPAIKVFKHLRTQFSLEAISFHLECLLFSLPDHLFLGGPADYIPALLGHISATPASSWYGQYLYTPCGERDIFVDAEWKKQDWEKFHEVATVWAKVARPANQAADKSDAIEYWRLLLGKESFPRTVS